MHIKATKDNVTVELNTERAGYRLEEDFEFHSEYDTNYEDLNEHFDPMTY